MCPGQRESAGKRKSARTRKGSPWLRATLIESARAASRTKGTHLSERYRRLARRRGDRKAIIAIAHEILDATWIMLSTGETTANEDPRSCPSATPTTPVAAPSASSNASATRSPSNRSGRPPDPNCSAVIF